AHHNWIVHVKLLGEGANRVGAVVHGNADDLQSTPAILVLEFDKTRDLLPAGDTPGCPEIEQHDPSAIRRESQPLAVQPGESEVRGKGMRFRAWRLRAGAHVLP